MGIFFSIIKQKVQPRKGSLKKTKGELGKHKYMH